MIPAGYTFEQMEDLFSKALSYRENAYAPYSHFKVGAVLLTKDGKSYGGANVENLSFGATVCAERTAAFKAVTEGEREFSLLLLCGGPEGEVSGNSTVPAEPCLPCGMCRQVLSEFVPEEFPVVVAYKDSDGTSVFETYTMGELMPGAFSADL